MKNKLDLVVGLCALATSVISIWLAISQGDDMERLVQAQSWPFLGFSSGNSAPNPQTGAPEAVLNFEIENLGVGPAKIKSFEMRYRDQALKGNEALLAACCDKADPSVPVAQRTPLVTSNVVGRVLRAGQKITLLNWRRGEDNATRWDQLDKARFDLSISICYCSVFDECWRSSPGSTEAQRVAQCPAVVLNYDE